MNRVNIVEAFTVPECYQMPAESELIQNTHYPNLNSLSYRVKIQNEPKTMKLQKFFEFLDVNSMGNAVLACNDYTDTKWNGSFWGFETINDVPMPDKASYKLQMQSTITNIKYVEANMVWFFSHFKASLYQNDNFHLKLLVSGSCGTLQLWSTQAEVRSPHGYCLFKIGSQSEHTGIITAMDVFRANYTKSVTADSDGCVKVWDMGTGDLYSMNTYNYGHIDTISGLSSSSSSEHIFATCSRDKAFKVWDYRQSKPVQNQTDCSQYAYTTLYWTHPNESNEQLYIGDETGHVNTVDMRYMSKFLNRIKYFDSPIHKIKFEQRRYVVLGNSNVIKVADTEQGHKVVYQNGESVDYVRDVHWNEKTAFYTIGWDMKMQSHWIC